LSILGEPEAGRVAGGGWEDGMQTERFAKRVAAIVGRRANRTDMREG
jgi:hypothetical protein